MTDTDELRAEVERLRKMYEAAMNGAEVEQTLIARLREELAGARATIEHQCEAMSWISGHDRSGQDHLREAMEACTERDIAEAKVRAIEELPHEDWCCAKGCAGPGFCEGCQGTEADCRCLVSTLRGVMAEAAAALADGSSVEPPKPADRVPKDAATGAVE